MVGCRAILILVLLLTAGCQSDDEETVTVFAAASTIDAVEEVLAMLDMPHVRIQTNFASTSTLEMLVRQGVKVDLFLAAHPDAVVRAREDHPDVTSSDLLANHLVIAGQMQSSEQNAIQSLPELTGCQRIAMGDPAHVPVGQYAMQVLQNAGIWEQVKDRLVLAADARQALALVNHGLVDAGIVYHTDAIVDDRVETWMAVEDEAAVATYPLIRFYHGRDSTAVNQVQQHLSSETAQAIFEKHGFRFVAPANAGGQP